MDLFRVVSLEHPGTAGLINTIDESAICCVVTTTKRHDAASVVPWISFLPFYLTGLGPRSVPVAIVMCST